MVDALDRMEYDIYDGDLESLFDDDLASICRELRAAREAVKHIHVEPNGSPRLEGWNGGLYYVADAMKDARERPRAQEVKA